MTDLSTPVSDAGESAAEQLDDAAAAGAYELLVARLKTHAEDLASRAAAINTERIDTFGSSKFEVAGAERIRTENNSVPRDMVAAGNDLLFGYNVFIGLKAETTVDDVFSLHHYRATEEGLALDPVPDGATDTWLHESAFVNDFRELYTYYKDARLLKLQRREGRLLAAFQTGQNLDDIRVFRWSVSPDGTVSYLDNRGERDFTPSPQFDFEWQPVTREHHVGGRNPHVNLVDRVFVDPTGGNLTIRLENNTEAGETVLQERVDDADQAVADTSMAFAILGDLVVVRVRPYQEEAERGYVVNTFTRSARRCDAILHSCQQLPEDHGIIYPSGYDLRTGEHKDFDLDTTGMEFETVRRSPNGEDVMYVFHERSSGLTTMLAYNMIRREIASPIAAHGWSLFEDGTLVVFREDADPTRVHPMQLWVTPFVSDEFHARQPVGDTMLHRIGNADLVRGISDALNIARQATDAEPSAAVYGDLTTSAARVIDNYYWLGESDVGDLAAPLTEIRKTAGLIIDEFDKVQTLRATASGTLAEASAEIDVLRRDLTENPASTAGEFVDALRRVRQQRGHLITLREVRYIDLTAIDALEAEMAANFEDLSGKAATFFADPTAFSSFHDDLAALETTIGETSGTAELEEHRQSVAELGDGLEVLAQVVSGLEIDDPTVRTEILERLADVMATLNRTRAIGDNRRKSLATAEGAAAFSVEMTLFAQSSSGELARLSTPEACDEALGRLLLQLEDLESRFAEFDAELEQIAHKRDETYEVFQTRKQALLDDRQRQGQRLNEAADRILMGVARRIERFESHDEMNAWFVADPMVAKVRTLADDLREIDQAVAADELMRRLDSAREDAGRSLRDRSDIYEEGGKIIRFGTHRFSVDTQPLELTTGVFDDKLHAVLTGTDYREPIPEELLAGTESFWSRSLASESPALSRAEFLAGSLMLDALYEVGGEVLNDFTMAAATESGIEDLVRNEAQERVDHGYERGVHDHDAALLLRGLLDRLTGAGLLRYSAQVRADAIIFWDHGLDAEAQEAWRARCRSLGRLRQQFQHSPAIGAAIQDLTTELMDFGRVTDASTSAEYLFEELAEDALEFDTSTAAVELADAFRLHHAAGDRLANEIQALGDDLSSKIELATAWYQAFVSAESPELISLVPEAVAMTVTSDLPRMPATADLYMEVSGLLSQHPRIDNGVLRVRIDEMLTEATRHRRDELPAFRHYQDVRAEALAHTRDLLRLDEYAPKVMSAFVRNQLIDQVYLPLIGDNLAKQLGSLDSSRTDQMGLLLLISPPGYGKTTLMEYIANRLGMVFVKVNGPALGTGVTSLDPSEAPDATAAQEVDKINFALEMGSNVLLYLDDIQHTNPELLQKFISMTDAQRRMEGVWKGRTRTYDLRGKRFAVVMAGNPYTESGERFAIPDMLANRADTYNLGDVFSGREELFALSYIENALASNPVLRSMTTRDLDDVGKMVSIAQGKPVSGEDLSHPYSAAELNEMTATFERLLRVQHVLLQVNKNYIASASMADEYRTEPPFQLQGSYRNMARLAEKILPVMNDAEIEALLDDHYRGEAQTLTSGAESNLLKLSELRGTLTEQDQARWDDIKTTFMRSQRTGDAGDDPMMSVASSLVNIGESLKDGLQLKWDMADFDE
jgi:MoxR-like ATPase